MLLVDDEPVVLRAFRRILESSGYDVVVAEGGGRALEILESDRNFGTVVCDLSMPDVDGIEVHRFLERAEPALAERLIFSTGGAHTDRAQQFLSRTDNPVVEKPLTPDELRAAVADALSSGRPSSP